MTLRPLTIMLTCLWLSSGCLTRRTEAVPDPNASGRDSAANGSMDAAGDTGASEGGASEGGGEVDGNTGTNGDGGKPTCNEVCDTPAASWCDPKTGQCAACQQSKDCSALPSTPACRSGLGCVECTPGDEAICAANGKVCADDGDTCVECNTPADCGDDKPVCSNHTCQKCTGAAEDCMGRANAFCDVPSGSCVQCIAGQTGACGGKVCNLVGAKPVCGDATPASANLCNPCVSDQQCQPGQLCVHMFWDNDGDTVKETDVGWFCQWQKNGGSGAPALCNSAARPYVGEQVGVSSADKPTESLTICTLAASTCPAISEAYRDPCGRFGTGAGSFIVEDISDSRLPNGTVGAQITPDDSVCGVGGKCVAKNSGDGAYQCSVGCLNSNSDCPVGPVTCGGAPPTTANICSI